MATIRLQRYLEFAEDYVLLDHGCYQHRPHGLYCDSRTQSSKTEKTSGICGALRDGKTVESRQACHAEIER